MWPSRLLGRKPPPPPPPPPTHDLTDDRSGIPPPSPPSPSAARSPSVPASPPASSAPRPDADARRGPDRERDGGTALSSAAAAPRPRDLRRSLITSVPFLHAAARTAWGRSGTSSPRLSDGSDGGDGASLLEWHDSVDHLPADEADTGSEADAGRDTREGEPVPARRPPAFVLSAPMAAKTGGSAYRLWQRGRASEPASRPTASDADGEADADDHEADADDREADADAASDGWPRRAGARPARRSTDERPGSVASQTPPYATPTGSVHQTSSRQAAAAAAAAAAPSHPPPPPHPHQLHRRHRHPHDRSYSTAHEGGTRPSSARSAASRWPLSGVATASHASVDSGPQTPPDSADWSSSSSDIDPSAAAAAAAAAAEAETASDGAAGAAPQRHMRGLFANPFDARRAFRPRLAAAAWLSTPVLRRAPATLPPSTPVLEDLATPSEASDILLDAEIATERGPDEGPAVDASHRTSDDDSGSESESGEDVAAAALAKGAVVETPVYLYPKIPWHPQTDAWDCGIAVVSMVLLALGKIDTPLFALAESPDQSVWTIDLATILQRFQVPDFTFFTSYIGINWQYTNDAFYNDALGDDRERVHRLFASAADAGIRVIPMALEASDLRRFLMSGQYAAIVLTDLRYLQCIACARGTGFMARRLFPLVQGWRAVTRLLSKGAQVLTRASTWRVVFCLPLSGCRSCRGDGGGDGACGRGRRPGSLATPRSRGARESAVRAASRFLRRPDAARRHRYSYDHGVTDVPAFSPTLDHRRRLLGGMAAGGGSGGGSTQHESLLSPWLAPARRPSRSERSQSAAERRPSWSFVARPGDAANASTAASADGGGAAATLAHGGGREMPHGRSRSPASPDGGASAPSMDLDDEVDEADTPWDPTVDPYVALPNDRAFRTVTPHRGTVTGTLAEIDETSALLPSPRSQAATASASAVTVSQPKPTFGAPTASPLLDPRAFFGRRATLASGDASAAKTRAAGGAASGGGASYASSSTTLFNPFHRVMASRSTSTSLPRTTPSRSEGLYQGLIRGLSPGLPKSLSLSASPAAARLGTSHAAAPSPGGAPAAASTLSSPVPRLVSTATSLARGAAAGAADALPRSPSATAPSSGAAPPSLLPKAAGRAAPSLLPVSTLPQSYQHVASPIRAAMTAAGATAGATAAAAAAAASQHATGAAGTARTPSSGSPRGGATRPSMPKRPHTTPASHATVGSLLPPAAATTTPSVPPAASRSRAWGSGTLPCTTAAHLSAAGGHHDAGGDGGFEGHYILLTDFLPDKGQFIYRDPGSDASLCYVTERVLERARGSVGTDNDVIVVRIAR